MWMFLLGLIVGILLMVLWFSYSQKYAESSNGAMPRKDFSSAVLHQNATTEPLGESAAREPASQVIAESNAEDLKDDDTKQADHRNNNTENNESVEVGSVEIESEVDETDHAETDTEKALADVTSASDSADHLDDAHNAHDETSSEEDNAAESLPNDSTQSDENSENTDDTDNADSEGDITAETAIDSAVESSEVDSDAVDANDINDAGDSGDAENYEVNIEQLMADLPTAETDADDLKKIKGIGPKLETMLNELGICTFKQVGALTDQQCKDVSLAIKTFPDRIYRDQWVEQAKQFHQEKYS